jgi:hypothetical protein
MVRLGYEYQSLNAVYRNNHYLFPEPYKTLKKLCEQGAENCNFKPGET